MGDIGGMNPPARSSLAAGIVAFGPDPETFPALLAALVPSVGRVYVFVNGLIDPGLRAGIECDRPDVVFIDSDLNFGVGVGLNLLALQALLAGYEGIVLFDQDSRPEAGMVEALVTARARLNAMGERPAAVGPRLVPPAGTGHKGPRYPAQPGRRALGDLTPVRFLPTSGTLLDLAAFRRVGAFRADYFIDAVDVEWCMRAWARGHSCWLAGDVAMAHTVGEGAFEALGLRTPRQRAFRMYSYVRNTMYGMRLPHVPLGWKLRQLVYVPAQLGLVFWRQGFDLSVLRRAALAARDGLTGRLGPPPGAALTRREDRDLPPPS